MTASVGQTLTVRAKATDPLTQHVITDAAATAYFYAPPKNPVTVAGDRTPDSVLTLTFDPASRYYTGSFPTVGWAAGNWWVRVAVTGGAGGYNTWGYTPLPLAA